MLAYYNMKKAGTGATFPSTPGAQRVLEMSLTVIIFKIISAGKVKDEHID
jgi:hypothetical protein